MEVLNNAYSSIARDFVALLQEFNEEDNPYVKRFKTSLQNKLNTHVNLTNFKAIVSFFKDKDDLKVLDLGSGIGEKAVLVKRLFPTFEVYGVETTIHDDPDHINNKPQELFSAMYEKVNANYEVSLGLYNGIDLPFEDSFFDVILLYAVIEHIAPEHRVDFINKISKKLTNKGYIVITRCPQYFGLMEFISRKLHLGSHEWVLKKTDLLSLFPEDAYDVAVLKHMNNIPNSSSISKTYCDMLLLIDKVLSFVKWPFFTDYFLIVQKKNLMEVTHNQTDTYNEQNKIGQKT